MGAEASTLEWANPFYESLNKDDAEEFARNIEASEDLIRDPDYLMSHLDVLFPDMPEVPLTMVRTITQSFIDRLRIQDDQVLAHVGMFFQDINEHNGTHVNKVVLRGYLVSVLSILMQAAMIEAARLGVPVTLKYPSVKGEGESNAFSASASLGSVLARRSEGTKDDNSTVENTTDKTNAESYDYTGIFNKSKWFGMFAEESSPDAKKSEKASTATLDLDEEGPFAKEERHAIKQRNQQLGSTPEEDLSTRDESPRQIATS